MSSICASITATVLRARNCGLARIDVLNQVPILFAERARILVNSCLVGVTVPWVGQSLVVVDSTDGVGLEASAGGKFPPILGLNLGVGPLVEPMRNKVKIIAVSIHHARSLRNIVGGLVG
jgi:hypothetical protein